MKKTILLPFLFLTSSVDPLEGSWVHCRYDDDGSYLYVTHFKNKQRVEVMAFSKSKSCQDFAKHAQAALILTWNYEINKRYIDQTLLTEKIALFQDTGVLKCNFREWIKDFNEKCLRDVSEFKNSKNLSEDRGQKRVAFELKSKNILILSDGAGYELYKVQE